MNETAMCSKDEASALQTSDQKCAVCDNLYVWPKRPTRDHRYKPSRAMHFSRLVHDCGYCQLIKNTIKHFDLIQCYDSEFLVRTGDGLIRISAIGVEDTPPCNVIVYTPDQVCALVDWSIP